MSAGAETVALTLGARGAVLLSARETLRAEAPEVPAIDTVGAGDVFCGTLVAARAEGNSVAASLASRSRGGGDLRRPRRGARVLSTRARNGGDFCAKGSLRSGRA